MTITSGPVLELGAGLGSTLTLHGLCGAQGKKLVTLESDHDWLNTFRNLGRSWHQLREVGNFDDLPEYDQHWGLAFVDHGISERRGHSVEKMKGNAEVIIAHDTCHFYLYNYKPVVDSFRYRWDWVVWGPRTSVLSDTVDVPAMLAGMGL